MSYITLLRKKIDQRELHCKTGRNSVVPVMLLLLQIGGKLWMMKGPDCDYDKRNISVVISDTDIP